MPKDRKKKFITKKGLEKLKAELKERTSVISKDIADKLDEAKAIGDLSENAAYTAALEEYQFNQTRISDLKDQIAKLEVAPDRSGDLKIDIGDKIEVKDLSRGKVLTYTIVGEGEGDPLNGLVSINSAVGLALVGKKVGQKVKVRLPVGETEYKILSVS